MAWRTNRKTRGIFRLHGESGLAESIATGMREAGRGDRATQMTAAVQEQIRKAKETYPDVEDHANRIWQEIAGGGLQGLRSSKPKDGRAAYVWRMLRFHTGADVHMPVTADWDLDHDIDNEVGYNYSKMGFDHPLRETARDKAKEEKKKLDAIVEYILATEYPLSQFSAALRWHSAGLF